MDLQTSLVEDDDIADAPPPPAPPVPPAPVPEPTPITVPELHALRFSGSGSEYFRIWIVNLMLTIATLGIYSAWAKVRRQQYFDRNTQLAGAVFDFTGDPKAILRGRILAVVLLGTYQYAFGFSLAFGLAVVLFLLVALPYLLQSALRFRLRNTRYRGMRFNFTGTRSGAYRSFLPPMLTVMLPTVLVASTGSTNSAMFILLLYPLWPWMHGSIRRYQQQHLNYGSLASQYELPARRFYGPYLKAFGISLAVFIGAIVLAIVIGVVIGILNKTKFNVDASLMGMLGGALAVYLLYLVAGCYLRVRLANLIWNNTQFPGVRFVSSLRVWPYLRLCTVNTLLTLLTLGLFRPFAVVRDYQYRLAHVQVETDSSFDHILATSAFGSDGGADGVADVLGIDLAF